MAERSTHLPGLQTAIIANGTAVSSPVKLEGSRIGGLILPAAWTAADLTFEGSHDGVTYRQVWDDANGEVLIASATMTARVGDILVPTVAIMDELAGLNYIRLVSGNTAANVNQGAERTFFVITKG